MMNIEEASCSSTSMLSDEERSNSTLTTIPVHANEISYNLKKSVAEEKKQQRAKQKIALMEEEQQIRRTKATKAMNYLLQNSQKYSSIFLNQLNNNKKLTMKVKYPLQVNKRFKNDVKFNDEAVAEFKKKSKRKTETSFPVQQQLIEQPKNFVGTLYPYQLEGLSWLKLLYENSVNGILADEMGLGKTIQVIALICSLLENKVAGPFLITAPLSTIPNWMSEFKRFAPKIPVVLFHGTGEQRPSLYPKIRHIYTVDGVATRPVVLTSYQTPMTENTFLRTFKWQYIIVDEGQRIKNFSCKLFGELKQLNSLNLLLLTGTPLQNHLGELWALLHFLMPQIFRNMDTFGDLFQLEDFNKSHKIMKQEEDTKIISTIHGVLSPFMLRRLKVDVLPNIVPKKEVLVYCPLSQLQADLYRYVLQKNIAKLTGKEEEEAENNVQTGRKRRKCSKITSYKFVDPEDDFTEDSPDVFNPEFAMKMSGDEKKAIHRQIKMCNPMVLMRKIVDHPFTVHCPVIPGTRSIVMSEDIVTQCGKMMVLDAMLIKLKERGHKVLIFCTFTSVLDFIEDYLIIREYDYCRLDGNTNLKKRQENINDFNTDPDKFVFLISTRAGGLGLNLTSADTVILFNRDWNPQADVQAQDRCHRIGQNKPVVVYTLISKGTIDEYILSRTTAKRRLEKIVIQKGKFENIKKPNNMIKSANDLKELEELLNSVDHKQVIRPNGFVLSNEELKRILDRSDLYKEMKEQNKMKSLSKQKVK